MATDLDLPTFIRQGLDRFVPTFIVGGMTPRPRKTYGFDLAGLVERCRFQVLFVEFVSRMGHGEIFWR